MRFPYGMADFQAIITEGYFYVDRTDRIRLIEEAGKQLLFLRPRRFGKSLWLSTLENYYDLARADDFERLFGGLKIGQNPIPGVSPVVLSDITSGYNVAEDLSQRPQFHGLCGFTESELRAALEKVAVERGLDAEQAAAALDLMRDFYNGYRFSPQREERL